MARCDCCARLAAWFGDANGVAFEFEVRMSGYLVVFGQKLGVLFVCFSIFWA